MRWELIIIVMLVFLILLPLGLSKKGDKEYGPNWDRTEVENGVFNQVIYSNDVNMKDSNGKYNPFSEVVSMDATNNAITIKWNGKMINFSAYVKANPGQVKKWARTNPENMNMVTSKNEDKGLRRWGHTIGDTSKLYSFGYDISSQGVSCSQKGQKYYCDELVIDFGEWVEKNLTLAMGLGSIEASNGDLSDLDPVVIINSTGQVKDTYIDQGTPSNAFGNWSSVRLKCCSTYAYGLIWGNLTTIPSNAVIYGSSFLTLKTKFAPSLTDTTTALYVINHSWNEGFPIGGAGWASNTKSINGSNWNERYYGDNASDGNSPFSESDPDWEVAGLGIHQDYNGTIVGQKTLTVNDNVIYDFNITSAAEWWLNGRYTNNGLLLIFAPSSYDTVDFYSKDSYGQANSQPPYFNITYIINPTIHSNTTIPSTPLWGQNITIRINITNSTGGNSLQFTNFTLTAPNATDALFMSNGTQFDSFWNSTKIFIWGEGGNGTWNWSVNATDWSNLSAVYNSSFTVNDAAPVISTVEFNATPVAGKDLRIVCTAIDAESNNISYYYQWYANKTYVIHNNSNISGGDVAIPMNLTGSCLTSDLFLNSSWSNTSTVELGDNLPPYFTTHNLSNSTQYSDTSVSFNISVWDASSEISQCWAEVKHPGNNVSNNSMSITLGKSIIAHLIFSNYTQYNLSNPATYNFSRVSCWDAANNYNSTYVNHPFNISQRPVDVSNMTINPSSMDTAGTANVSVLCTKYGSVTISSATYTVDPPSTSAANYSLSEGADSFWSASYTSTDTGTHTFTHFYCTDSNGNTGSNASTINLTVSAVAVDSGRGGGGGGASETSNISGLISQAITAGKSVCGDDVCSSDETAIGCWQDCGTKLTELTPFVRGVIWMVLGLFIFVVIKSQTSKRRARANA